LLEFLREQMFWLQLNTDKSLIRQTFLLYFVIEETDTFQYYD